MKNLMIFVVILFFNLSRGQPVCGAYKQYGEITKYKACLKSEETKDYYQFTKEYQEILDSALEIDSTYAYAYQAKGYAYLKSGDFITWEKLMAKAVEYEPEQYLGYRGWCRYQFFRDYKGAINDIEHLEQIAKGDIGFGQNGNYHLEIAKALCYKGIGKKEIAIEIIKNQLNKENHFVGLFDYLHLGILYFETGQIKKAIEAFQFQESENTLAENEFYLALSYNFLKDRDNYEKYLTNAYELYIKGRHMFDPYTHQMDRVFLIDIESEMDKAGLSYGKKRM